MTVSFHEFWRVGRRADPLHVDVRYQGAGRFDDPERLVSILYGAPVLRTCLLEFMLPWAPASGAPTVLQAIPEPTNDEEAIDAARDLRIAAEPRRVPKSLYERVAVRVNVEPALALLDLRDVGAREQLAQNAGVSRELQRWGLTQLDRGALLSPHRALTQAITGAVLRGGALLSPVDGLFAESRHAGDIVAVFVGEPFAPRVEIVEIALLTPLHDEIVTVAEELGLVP